MKNKLLFMLIGITLLCFPKIHFGQAPNMGTAADFVLFSSVGAVSNTGLSHLTGNVGSNLGSSTGFGNVNGVMHDGDLASAQCSADLTLAYNQLNATVPTFFPAPLLGNGQILNAGVYSIGAPATLNLDLTLDGQGDPTAVFIIQINGSFSTNANSKVRLINGALACNVFWKVEGLVDMATGTSMKGTIVANNAAINMNTGDTLEGRALSTSGAITIDGVLAYTPIGCGSPVLTGPLAPNMASSACYAVFSSDGPVTNVGVTNVTGDVGTNNGLTVGFDPLLVMGTIHPIPDPSTVLAASDLLNAYAYLNGLPFDIELLYPAQFGNSLVLTPHTYLLNAAVTFTDTVFLDAQGDPNAVFVIQVKGAFSTSTFSQVVLINGTQSKNVYWMVDGAVDINDNSTFRGTIICNNGAIDINTGVFVDGRVLTTTGALGVSAATIIMPTSCAPFTTTEPIDQIVCEGSSVSFSVVTTGINLTYQWRKGIVDLIDGGSISGAQTPTLTINPTSSADAALNYNVVIIGDYTPNDTSNFVSLTVNKIPVITTEPTDQLACSGNSVNFDVVATGTNLSYQWRRGLINLTDGLNISGATTATLTINPVSALDAALDYNVVVSGSCLPDATSINVSLTIDLAPSITTQPTDQTVCLGSSVNFAVIATGTNLTYQWRRGIVDLVDGLRISGATTAMLTINPTVLGDAALDYNVVVSGSCLPNAVSVNVSLTINEAPSITTQPIDQTVCTGNIVTFDVIATGTNLTYQWRRGLINLVDGLTISGATTASLTINPVSTLDGAINYNVVVSGTCLPDATSINVSLTVNEAPVITIQPIDQTVCSGSSVSFDVLATGTNITYQWQKGLVDLTDGGTITGATTATLTISPVTIADAAINYHVIISGTCLPDATSVDVSLTIDSAPVITIQPSNQIACEGASASFTVTATGTNLNYQWRKGIVDLVDGLNISGATTATLTINPTSALDAANNYNVVITGNCLPVATSVTVSLTVTPLPIANASSNSPVCAGTALNLSADTVQGATYAWTGPNGFNAATQYAGLANAQPINAGNYSLIVAANGCFSAPSITAVVVNICVTDLSVVKTANNMTPNIGHTIVFTIVAANNGPDNATNVTVSDLLQNGYSYLSSTASTGTYDEITGVWNIGSMNSGTSATLTITATVNVTGNYVNTANITGNENDGNLANNTSSITPVPTDFFIPEGFSPNGDGVNDLFVIRGIDNFPTNVFDIYNRWGDKIFSANPYTNTWDGTCNTGFSIGGDALPIGTYFYVLDLDNDTPVFKGTIYLNR